MEDNLVEIERRNKGHIPNGERRGQKEQKPGDGQAQEMFWGQHVSHTRTWGCMEAAVRLKSYAGALCLW